MQNKINMLTDRLIDLSDSKGDDPVRNANIDKQIASIRLQLANLRKQKEALGDQEEDTGEEQ